MYKPFLRVAPVSAVSSPLNSARASSTAQLNMYCDASAKPTLTMTALIGAPGLQQRLSAPTWVPRHAHHRILLYTCIMLSTRLYLPN